MLRKDMENPFLTLEKLLKSEEAAGGDVHQEGPAGLHEATSEKPPQTKRLSLL